MYVLLATIKIQPDQIDAFKELIAWQAERSIAEEEGCLQFDVNQHTDEPGTFILYEVYTGEAAVEAHRSVDRYNEFRAKAGPMFDGDPAITFLNRLQTNVV